MTVVQDVEVTEQITLEALREVAPGTGYVETMSTGDRGTRADLAYPFGRTISVLLDDAPAAAALPAGIDRALAVHVRVGSTTDCTLLGSSVNGPVRTPITMAQALGFAAERVHTVFMTD